ncbi:MAG: amidohydrolase [Euryarchaeota archaeon]|nr:amidohydrolase [Euryarchaeota archaeon]MDE1835012.1 amidohydrolase [Euryarchaeota archaeon]MDE1881333.1 amidohydrolase [Euryarchaeota archaeon]MDE2044851.1 amidohydrolase [Thermoplasmata archaeon]
MPAPTSPSSDPSLPLSPLEAELQDILPRASAWRQAIHRSPELAYGERGTQATVLEVLRRLGIPAEKLGDTTAVVGLIAPKAKGRCVGVRADMDALPICEGTGAPFASTNGAMHACGHDVHVASLLGAAAYWKAHEGDLPGPVKLLFQPAEEEGATGGALPMVKAGVLDSTPRVDAVFAIHLKNVLPNATFGVRPGPAMASPDHFEVKVLGRGGHAAYPHKAIDPVVMASEVVVGLQAVVSRYRDPLDPVVVSVSMIHGGEKDNILPDKVELEGTIRTVRPDTRDRIEKVFHQRVRGIVESAGGKVEIVYHRGYPVTVNPPKVAALVEEALRQEFPSERVLHLEEPYMGGEDFSRFLEERPGLYMFVGTDDGGAGGQAMHSARYLPPERAVLTSMAGHVCAVRALQHAPASALG